MKQEEEGLRERERERQCQLTEQQSDSPMNSTPGRAPKDKAQKPLGSKQQEALGYTDGSSLGGREDWARAVGGRTLGAPHIHLS